MAEALETKKRRLYKLLDNLSSASLNNTSTRTLSTTPSANSAKRSLTATERFDAARDRASKRLRHSTSTGSTTSIRPTKVSPAKSTAARREDDGKSPPNFSPWSHEMFLDRLRSFSSVSLWHPKPEGIGEVEWAKRGWRCVGVNTVGCKRGCERRVVVSLDKTPRKNDEGGGEDEDEKDGEDEDDAQELFEHAMVKRYKHVIAEGHAEHCMWRSSGCKNDVYRLQVIRPSIWQPELRKQCTSVLSISPSIERVKVKPLETDGVKAQPAERLLKDLPLDLTGADNNTTTPEQASKVLEIALHGWRGSREAGSELLHCDACFQRIGLWMYQPDYKPSANTATTSEDEETTEGAPVVDLTELHRDHCPWRNPSTQRASGSLAGLNASQVLQRVVTTFARDHRRRSAEQQGHRGGLEEERASGVEEEEEEEGETPKVSREEVAKQDKERESRLRKLKSLFSVRRKPAKAMAK